jgi:SAM-dependent methyltransferase
LSIDWKTARAAQGLKPGRVLDVGCGSGEFLARMRGRGWEVWGIEKDAAAAALARNLGANVVIGDPADASLPHGRFDLITFWHALEHLPDLSLVVRRTADWVKPRGRLAIALPNPGSLEAHFYGPRWVAWDAPRHLYHFRPKDVRTLFEPHGFRFLRSLALPLDPFYHALLSELSWHTGAAAGILAVRGLILGAASFLNGLRAEQGSSLLYLFDKA